MARGKSAIRHCGDWKMRPMSDDQVPRTRAAVVASCAARAALWGAVIGTGLYVAFYFFGGQPGVAWPWWCLIAAVAYFTAALPSHLARHSGQRRQQRRP